MSALPAKQTNYELALEQAFDKVGRRDRWCLESLGAKTVGDRIFQLPVLTSEVMIDLSRNLISSEDGAFPLDLGWRILLLHYLSAPVPWPLANGWVSFGDFAAARGYESVYRARVIQRLCATAGRCGDTFVTACHRVGGIPVAAAPGERGDDRYFFKMFPALPVMIARYEGDDELPPGASFVYPDNALSLLPIEDLVVLSERLVGHLHASRNSG